jgi:2-polyprenyl-3-methyl-5-hydroxy-6-metoxy-1,4-benzoquinol methylase
MTTTNSAPFTHTAQTWNNRFAKDGYVFGTEPNEWLRRHASVWIAGSRILCVADGEGRNSVWLAKQGHQVEAFDISEVGVAKARRLAQESQVDVDFAVAGCDDFAWKPNHYDGVAAIFVQFADPDLRARLFENIVRSLKPGGTLTLVGYTPKQLDYGTGGPSVLSHLYTSEMLRESFGELNIQALDEYETELAEGDGHKGRSAVIGLVAMRGDATR